MKVSCYKRRTTTISEGEQLEGKISGQNLLVQILIRGKRVRNASSGSICVPRFIKFKNYIHFR